MPFLINRSTKVLAFAENFFCPKKVQGKISRATIGPCDAIDIKTARDLAREKITEMAKGVDHAAAAKRNKVLAVTLRQAAECYIRDRRNLKPTTTYSINRHIDKSFRDWSKHHRLVPHPLRVFFMSI